MKSRLLYVMTVLAVLAFAGSLYAEPGQGGRFGGGKGDARYCEDGRGMGPRDGMGMGPGEGRGMGPRHFFGDPAYIKEQLGLSDDQVNKIDAINTEHRKQMLTIREQLEPRRIRLEKMLLEENVDLSQVRAVLKEIADLQVELRLLRIKHHIAIEKVLTADQRAKLRAEREAMRMHHPPDRDDN
ncbi:MAG: periplasmic heavy metal sensor [Spirochaetes bacterium]|nr:MAG: periplasmic heavy metal sensor [Spirochaetota bacterium]